ncbi:unnamed protein product [Enterobius vermicularis]|uniref:BED-type domain-containing protein n=1 Tax=Enterobius vermicularis TaxID=51028 RepID=A0A0N4V4H1_ENTVE|nr:unnamed protein product [Enterobius vermicularis]
MGRSVVWNYFQKNEYGAVCEIKGCKKQLRRKKGSGSTKQFWDHLKHCHHLIYETLQKDEKAGKNPNDMERRESEMEMIGPGPSQVCEQITLEGCLNRGCEKKLRNVPSLKITVESNMLFSYIDAKALKELLEKAYPGSIITLWLSRARAEVRVGKSLGPSRVQISSELSGTGSSVRIGHKVLQFWCFELCHAFFLNLGCPELSSNYVFCESLIPTKDLKRCMFGTATLWSVDEGMTL